MVTNQAQTIFRNWQNELREEGAARWIVSIMGDAKTRELLLISVFVCWRERCSRIFRDEYKVIEVLTREVLEQWRISPASSCRSS